MNTTNNNIRIIKCRRIPKPQLIAAADDATQISILPRLTVDRNEPQ